MNRTISHNINKVTKRIDSACRRVGRNPNDISMVLATKTVDPDRILEAAQAGNARVFPWVPMRWSPDYRMIQSFLKENAGKDGVMTTLSGLQYKVMVEGEGDKPAPTDVVKVHYTGKLLDGSVFDSSVERGEPVEFPLNRVIPGWTEGLQLMSPGAKYRFWIPANLAYGEQGNQRIGPNQVLDFEVELLEVK